MISYCQFVRRQTDEFGGVQMFVISDRFYQSSNLFYSAKRVSRTVVIFEASILWFGLPER